MRVYIAVTSPYLRERGVTRWYQSLSSPIFSMFRWKINGKKFATGMHESLLYNPTISIKLLFPLDHPSFDSCIPSIFHYSGFRNLYTNL